MSDISKTWGVITSYLDMGLSVFPVRDKDSLERGKVLLAKTPFYSWAKWQTEIITKDKLWDELEKFDTTAIAIVTGKISENLEVIDIDSKYKEGVSMTLFSLIKQFLPDIYPTLRIHKTPSGGYHILYRIESSPITPLEGNQKLAGRYGTEAEFEEFKAKHPKSKKKTLEINFLETRGEGGYILCPPSLGYSVYQDVPIPLISWYERCEIINLCRSLNEIIKIESKVKTTTKKETSAYEESPWDDFNERGDISELLSNEGWREVKHTNDTRIYYTRPGKSDGVSASFHKSQRYFWVFSSSTDYEEKKAYSPTDLLLDLKFSGDSKECFKWLVSEGYGKVKPYYEEKVIKRKALKGDSSIPNNFSDTAKKSFEDLKQQLTEVLPFGYFWEEDYEKTGRFTISREDLYRISDKLGFKQYIGMLVRVNGAVISEQTENDYFNAIKNYIWEEEADVYKDICNSFESFLQKSGKFTIGRLKEVDKSLIMADGKHHSYKFFNNGFVKVTRDGSEFKTYDKITGLVWEHKVQKRDWHNECPNNHVYLDYLKNAIGVDDYTKRVIGYLAHDYKEESSGYIIVLVERVPDPKDGGGSGKNIFGNMFRYTNTVKTVPGSQVKFDENFLQPWNHQRIYFLADLPKRIDWLFLKEMATGTGIHKRLYKDQVDIESHDMPKLLLNTNYSYEENDGGLIRRIRHLEFTPYYTINGGVDVVHGKMFPNDFDDNDWAGFDHLMCECITLLLKSNGKLEKTELSEEGWEKKFQMQYGEITHIFLKDNIAGWCLSGFVANNSFNSQYVSLCNEYDVPAKYRLSAKAMSNAVKDFCNKNNISVDVSYLKKTNGLTSRGKFFGKVTDECPF